MEELFVVSWVVSGDMIGDACTELEVVTDEALTAEAEMEAADEVEETNDVWTLLGFLRNDDGDWNGLEFMFVVVDISEAAAVADREGLSVPGIAHSGNRGIAQWRSLALWPIDEEGPRI